MGNQRKKARAALEKGTRRKPYVRKSKPFPFLRLPQELRDQIYEHMILPAGDVELDYDSYNTDENRRIIRCFAKNPPERISRWLSMPLAFVLRYITNAQQPSPQIAWVNRQVNHEVVRMVLAKAHIRTRVSVYTLHSFWTALSVDHLSLIRDLSIDFNSLPYTLSRSPNQVEGETEWHHIIGIMARHMQLRNLSIDFVKISAWPRRFPDLFASIPVLEACVRVLKSLCRLLASRSLDVFRVRAFDEADIERSLNQPWERRRIGECGRRRAMKRGLLKLEHLHWLGWLKEKLGLVAEIVYEHARCDKYLYGPTYPGKRYLVLQRRDSAKRGDG